LGPFPEFWRPAGVEAARTRRSHPFAALIKKKKKRKEVSGLILLSVSILGWGEEMSRCPVEEGQGSCWP